MSNTLVKRLHRMGEYRDGGKWYPDPDAQEAAEAIKHLERELAEVSASRKHHRGNAKQRRTELNRKSEQIESLVSELADCESMLKRTETSHDEANKVNEGLRRELAESKDARIREVIEQNVALTRLHRELAEARKAHDE